MNVCVTILLFDNSLAELQVSLLKEQTHCSLYHMTNKDHFLMDLHSLFPSCSAAAKSMKRSYT